MKRSTLLAAAIVMAGAASAEPGKVLPPAVGIYHSANPDFTDTEDKVGEERIAGFEKLTGKRIVWAYFSDNWFKGIRFPRRSAQIIRAHGAIPFMRLLARGTGEQTCADKKYSLQKIIDGKFDAELIAYAREVKAFGPPIMMEFGTEMNGDWFQWSGPCNGGGTRKVYGSPREADGPERFRDAYRHIVELFRREGAGFVTWAFHVNGENHPASEWNTHEAYYPGDDYVDWIGLSVYGALTPADAKNGDTPSLRRIMDGAYRELAAVSAKPLALLEFGVVQYPGKAKWIEAALADLASGRWPRLKAIASWNDRWVNDDGSVSNLRIDSSPEALTAYRTGLASPTFVTVPRLTP
jgi:hypothetical protein